MNRKPVYSGDKFGRLTLVSVVVGQDNRMACKTLWNCLCECGGSIDRTPEQLKSAVHIGRVPSCGCWRKEMRALHPKNKVEPSNYVGKRYGKLTVSEVEWKPSKYSNGMQSRLLCICDCGKSTSITVSSALSGNTVSCGCHRSLLTSKRTKKLMVKHGDAVSGKHYGMTPTYQCWMKVRKLVKSGSLTLNPQACHELDPMWHKYAEFFKDFGEIRSDQTISRFDKHKPWSKDNCYVRVNVKRQANKRIDASKLGDLI